MGRRTLRIRHQAVTAEALRAWVGRAVDVVDQHGATRHGTLLSLEPDALVLEDLNRAWYNLRRHRHRVLLSSISEVTLAAWQGW